MRRRSLLVGMLALFLVLLSLPSLAATRQSASKAKSTAAAAPSAARLIVRSVDAAMPVQDDAVLLGQARAIFGQLPKQMPGSESDTPEQIDLGRRLYFEKALSVNQTQACNDCHRIDGIHGGADTEPTSLGATGKRGDRNSNSVLNAGFQLAQFWDGRAANLAEQAKGPVLNPVEMGIPDENAAMKQLAAAGYEPLFQKGFPSESKPFTFDNMARAIGAFERTLVTPSRFDLYLAGDPNALTPLEKRGLAEFMNSGCVRCHNSAALGGMLYQQLGIAHPYATVDPGREEVTKRVEDRHAFKVPVLRNAVITGPYFHSGKVATIAEAIDLMGWHQLDRRFSNQEIDVLTRFLTSLSDTNRTTAKTIAVKAPPKPWIVPSFSELPSNPLQRDLIRYGYDLVTNTHHYLGAAGLGYAGNELACRNCHQESGTKAYGVSWVGIANRYPRMSDRSGKIATLQDRINDCMERSMNGKRLANESREMRAIVSYMNWLTDRAPTENAGMLLVAFDPPNRRADMARGAEVYAAICQNCHGPSGEGYRAVSAHNGGGWVAPPLAGAGSYNSGAGTARVLTAAAFVYANMPVGVTWDRPAISIDDAYDVAAVIDSFDRPDIVSKANDYPDRMKKPIDTPYGPYADPFTADQHKYGPFQPIQQLYSEHGHGGKGTARLAKYQWQRRAYASLCH